MGTDKRCEYRKNTINRYSLKEEHLAGNVREAVSNYDLLTSIIICLGNESDGGSGILKLLEVLLSSERKAEEKKQILQNDFRIKMTKTLEREVSVMCNLSKGVEEKGIMQGILTSLRNLMETMGWSIEQAMDALKLPEEERELYIRKLKE